MPRSRGKSIKRSHKKTRTHRKKSRNTRKKKISRGGNCKAWADKKNPGNAKSNFHKLCELIESTGDIYTITPADSVKLLDDMVDIYFNDNSVLEEIYKSMRSKDFCFLHKIIIDVSWNVIPTHNNIYMYNHFGKLGEVFNYFSPAVYYEKQIMDCSSNIYAIPIHLITSTGGHSNILIVQNNENEKELVVEHFEPHGRFYQHETHLTNEKIAKMVDRLVYSLFGDPANPATKKTKDGKEIIIIKPSENCPMEIEALQGFLSDSPEWKGSCEMFSMWYAFMRLSSPKKPSADIYQTMYTILRKGNPVKIIQAIIKAFQGLITVAPRMEGVIYTVRGQGPPRLIMPTVRDKIVAAKKLQEELSNFQNVTFENNPEEWYQSRNAHRKAPDSDEDTDED